MSDNIEAEKTVTVPNAKTVVSFNLPSPVWATWVFRIVFLLTTAAGVWVAATGMIATQNKVEILLAMKVFDVLIWGIGRGLGVKKEDFADVT